MEEPSTKHNMSAWFNIKFKVIAGSVIVGVLAGIVIVFYRYALELALDFSHFIYGTLLGKPWLIPLWFAVLIIAGLFVGFLVKKEPMLTGSGIPQVKGVLHKRLKMSWLRVVIGKPLGGILAIGAGLSLGREGPSVQIGAAVGQGYSRLLKKARVEEKYLVTSGASAGLAAAFNAPLSGVVFALEELHKNFSPTVMISALIASISADFVSNNFFGQNPVFSFSGITPIPLEEYYFLLFLGVLAGVLGILFNKSLLKFQDLYRKISLPAQVKPVIAFVTAGVLGFFLPGVLGGGHGLVSPDFLGSLALSFLVMFLIVKFLFTMVSYGSSAPGGIFLPLLVIGALIGYIYSNLLTLVFGYNQSYAMNFVILGMAAYFTAIVKAPITGIILITEMTGSFSNLLPVAIVCMISFVVTELLNSKPIYDVLLDRFINRGSPQYEKGANHKTILEVAVHVGSALDGKRLKDVEWPANCLIVGINREGAEIIPSGDTRIAAGDYLIVITDEDESDGVRESLLNNAADIR